MKKDAAFILFLFLFSLLIRLLFMNAGLFHHDSVQLALAVEKGVQSGSLGEAVGGKLGLVLLNVLLYTPLFHFFGITSSAFIITMSTILFGALAVPLLYLIILELTKKRFLALSTSLLLSTTPLFLSITTYAKSPGVAVFFALLGLYFLLVSMKTSSKKLAIASSLSLGFLLFIRPSEVLVLIPLGLFFLLFGKKNHLKKSFLASLCFPFLFLLVFFILTQGEGFLHYFSVNAPGFDNDNILLAIKSVYLTVTLVGFPFILLGGVSLWKKERKLFSFLFIWFFLLFIYNTSTHTFAPRYLTVAIIPLIILMGYGITYVYKQHALAGYFILFLVATTLFISIYPVLSYRHAHSGGKDLAMAIDSLSEEYTVVVGDEGPFFSYYTNPDIILYPYSDAPERVNQLILAINQSLQQGKDVFIPETNFILHHPPQAPKNVFTELQKHFSISIASTLVWENYHKSALESEQYTVHIFKIENM